MPEKQKYYGIRNHGEKQSSGILRNVVTLLVVCCVIFTGVCLYGCRSSKNDADGAKQARGTGTAGSAQTVETQIAAGRKLFGSLCKGCHGKEGRGDVGPNLTVSTYKYGKSKPEIIKTITGGRPGGMPAFSSQLDREQIESLAEFVLTLK
ncbi:MAG TPA: c-type cytochrome [Dongiaceae bacterium]|nr:c-type cytochrome [Dongiaceae bacterium]